MSDLWLPGAERVPNAKAAGLPYVGGPWRFVFHTIEAKPSAANFRALARRHKAPPHFWAMPSAGLLLQTVPVNRSAFALKRPSGGPHTNRLQAVQVELWGFARDMKNAPVAWLDWLAEKLIAPVAGMVPINLGKVKATGPASCYGQRSSCRMSADEWRRFDGVCGHQHVPGNSHWDPGELDLAYIAGRAQRILVGRPQPVYVNPRQEAAEASVFAEVPAPLHLAAPVRDDIFQHQAPAGSSPRRLVVDRHPLLAGHAGTRPDLVLRWNAAAASAPSAIDVVVHFHGYSGKGKAMRLERDKEPASGLDVDGRTRPTLAVLPRGHYFGGKSGMGYSFPALTKAGGLQSLIDDAMARFKAATGVDALRGRLILTAHSGGGKPVLDVLKHVDPDEVHVFDGLYQDAGALAAWAARKISSQGDGALRVTFVAGSRTAGFSTALRAKVCRALAGAGAVAGLGARYRVEATTVGHNAQPKAFGGLLLADVTVDLPKTKRMSCGGGGREAYEDVEGDVEVDAFEAFEEEAFEDYEGEGEDWELFAEDHEHEFSGAFEDAEESGETEWDFEEFEPGHELEGETDSLEAAGQWEAEEFFEAGFETEADFEAEGLYEGEAVWEAEELAVDEEAGEVEAAEAGEFEEAFEGEFFVDKFEDEFEDEALHACAFPSGVRLNPVQVPERKGQEYYDPHRSGTPVYDTGPAVRATRLSPDFTVGELAKSGGRHADVARISCGLVRLLQGLRDAVGKPIKITSGYRSYGLNARLYKAKGKEPTQSRHSSGDAADIRIAGMTGMEIAKKAIDVWGPHMGVGVGANFAHVDVRPTWSAWTYLSGAAGKAAVREITAYRQAKLRGGGGASTPVPRPSPAPSPSPRPSVVGSGPVGPFATIVAQAPGRPEKRYTFTAEDVLWMARFIKGEAGGRDDRANDAVLWAMFNHFALFRSQDGLLARSSYATFADFLRAYSTPLQSYLRNPSAVYASIAAAQRSPRLEWVQWGTFRYTGKNARYRGKDIPKGQYRHHLVLQGLAWNDPALATSARIAQAAARGERSNPIGLANEFANTAVYYRRKHGRRPERQEWAAYNEALGRQQGWRWIGDVPGIEQYLKNTFFMDNRIAAVPGLTVRLVR